MDICLATRPHNGGLINLQELCALLRQRRRTDRGAVSEDDCLRAISKLKVLYFSIYYLSQNDGILRDVFNIFITHF